MEDKRTFLYKEGHEPTIFDGDKAIDDAVADGWVDSPDKVAVEDKPKRGRKPKDDQTDQPEQQGEPTIDKQFGDI